MVILLPPFQLTRPLVVHIPLLVSFPVCHGRDVRVVVALNMHKPGNMHMYLPMAENLPSQSNCFWRNGDDVGDLAQGSCHRPSLRPLGAHPRSSVGDAQDEGQLTSVHELIERLLSETRRHTRTTVHGICPTIATMQSGLIWHQMASTQSPERL